MVLQNVIVFPVFTAKKKHLTRLSSVDNFKEIIVSDDNKDAELLTLLDLDGYSFWRDEKYWVKFEAKRVKKDEHRPHGIRYSDYSA